MTPDSHDQNRPLEDEPLRHHSYDGIQEYDRKLPNWWLLTFYGSIIFAVGYYACYEWWKALPDQAAIVKKEMARIDAIRLASVSSLSDDNLWAMSNNANFVESGKATFLANCASCHKPDLTGNIGPNLIDATWIHGGQPLQIYTTITNGVAVKGMPTWGPVLGTKKITEAAAFILSHHKPKAGTGEAEPR